MVSWMNRHWARMSGITGWMCWLIPMLWRIAIVFGLAKVATA